MPEGDTIAWAANRIRPVLEGVVPDSIETPHPRHALDRWPARLEGRAVTEVRTHGKHLFLHFDGGLVLHSHLGMTGAWGVYAPVARLGPGDLSGDYAGAQGSASVGIGVGGNVLVGGSNNSIALQPLSVQGQVGFNVAAGLESLELRPGR